MKKEKTLKDLTLHEFVDMVEGITQIKQYVEHVYECIVYEPVDMTAEASEAMKLGGRKLTAYEVKNIPEHIIPYIYAVAVDLKCQCVAAGNNWYEQRLCYWGNKSYDIECVISWNRSQSFRPNVRFMNYHSIGKPHWRTKSDSFEICAQERDMQCDFDMKVSRFEAGIKKSYINIYRTKTMMDIISTSKKRLTDRINFLMAMEDDSEFINTDVSDAKQI